MPRRGSVWQLDGLPATPTQNLPREKWLELRRAGIGGSDIAGILGISPWTTPLGVYCDKAGLRPDRDPTEDMEFGLRMEPTLRKWAEDEINRQYGSWHKVLASPYLYQHPTVLEYLGNVDGVVLLDEHPIAGLEIKTVDRFAAREWADGKVPEYYAVQAQWYMGVTKLEHWIIAALIGKHFEIRIIHGNQQQIEDMQRRASEFWETYVQPRVMPEAVGEDANLLLDLYGVSSEDILQAEDMEGVAGAYLALKADIKVMGEQCDDLKARLEQRIGEAKGLQAGPYLATWNRYIVSHVDSAALREQYPDVYASVVKVSRVGRLNVKEKTWKS